MSLDVVVALIAGAALGAGAAIVLEVRRASRIRRVRHGVREVGSGNLAHRIVMAGGDDVAALASDFDLLADVIQQERENERAREHSRRELIANISHDLRTPVTSIAGYVDALRRGLGDDPERYLAIIEAKTAELAALTDDLFFEARLDSGDLRLEHTRVDLAESVRLAVLGFEPELSGRQVRVTVDIPQDECALDADPTAVARILGNLLSNALRHGERMTRLAVSVGCERGGRTVRIVNDGARPPEDLERLFERGVAGTGGAGLGLTIARELAERMGAVVRAERAGADEIAFVLEFRES